MQNTTTPLSPEQQSWLEQTFSRNRGLFGGYVMEEGAGDESGSQENEEESTEENSEESTENTPESDEEGTESNEENEEEESSTLSHDDALAALSKTRKSEARYRTRLRELEKSLEGAKTEEEVAAIVTKIKDENATEARQLLVENVALKHSLPADLAEALKGDTRDELEAHAKVLAKYAGPANSDDPDLEGGLDPKELGGTGKTAEQLSREARRRRR